MTQRTYTGTNKAVNVFAFKEPLLQAILEISREDEIYQSLNRGRLVLDNTIHLVLLTNIVLDQIPVTNLVCTENVLGKTVYAPKQKHSRIIRDLMERQLQNIGFSSVSRTIRPLVESGVMAPQKFLQYFVERQADIQSFDNDFYMTRRSIESHVSAIAHEMKLSSFRMFYQTEKRNGYFDILGSDESCIAHASNFFRSCPGYESAILTAKSEL